MDPKGTQLTKEAPWSGVVHGPQNSDIFDDIFVVNETFFESNRSFDEAEGKKEEGQLREFELSKKKGRKKKDTGKNKYS